MKLAWGVVMLILASFWEPPGVQGTEVVKLPPPAHTRLVTSAHSTSHKMLLLH